ncbi:MAG: Bug family tripartite tricarboxylate transporter substrate binding protein [Janthinobacterium lividum]
MPHHEIRRTAAWHRRDVLHALCAGLGASLIGTAAHAADYPARPMRVIVPFPAAGSADILTRVLANALQKPLGQTLVVDNRAGGGGSLGINLVSHAEPDGYTMGVTSLGPQVLLPAMGRKLPYDADKDLVHIGYMGGMPLAIIGSNKLAARTLPEMVALAKTQPGKLSIGSSGIPGQLAIEQFKRIAGVDLLHVPYKGDAPLATDLIGGQIDLAMITLTSIIPFVGGNSFRIMATTGARRAPQLRDAPTVAEQGNAGFEAELWYALTAPRGTPRAAVDKLSGALAGVLADPEVQRQFVAQGLSSRTMDAAATTRFIAAERKKWGDIITSSGIKLEE